MSAELQPTFNPNDGEANWAERQTDNARHRAAEREAVDAAGAANTLGGAAVYLERAAIAADSAGRPVAAAAYRQAAVMAREGVAAEARAILGWETRSSHVVPVPLDNR
jgi:hypothetical protein